MKKLTIQFIGMGLQDETTVQGFETSNDLLNAIANYADGGTYAIKNMNEPLFDYETGTMWKIMEETNEQLKAENERLKEQYRLAKVEQNYWVDDFNKRLKEKDELLDCYKDEEIKIAKILGDKDLTIIGSRVHLENLITELRNKLQEKDEEIARQKEYYRLAKVEQDYWVNDFNKCLENNTKQVCEKIRNHADESIIDNVVEFTISADLLDQIERGENDQ